MQAQGLQLLGLRILRTLRFRNNSNPKQLFGHFAASNTFGVPPLLWPVQAPSAGTHKGEALKLKMGAHTPHQAEGYSYVLSRGVPG